MTASIHSDPYYVRNNPNNKLFQILLNLREISRNPDVRRKEQSYLLESRLQLMRRQAIIRQIKKMTAQDLIDFENWTKSEWESGNLPSLIHLCGGNEGQLLYLWQEIQPGDWIFSTHRNHYHALLAGIPADKVKEFILNGRSMFVYSREHNFCCSAVLAGCCGIAAGVAWSIKNGGDAKYPVPYADNGIKPDTASGQHNEAAKVQSSAASNVWCFIGDGGIEQGHFWEAINFVEGHRLPCTFIVEDNNRSVDTDKADRRGLNDVIDKALSTYKCVRRYEYTPTYPHAGSGCNFQIQFKPEAIERLKPKNGRVKSFMDSMEPFPNTDEYRRATGL